MAYSGLLSPKKLRLFCKHNPNNMAITTKILFGQIKSQSFRGRTGIFESVTKAQSWWSNEHVGKIKTARQEQISCLSTQTLTRPQTKLWAGLIWKKK